MKLSHGIEQGGGLGIRYPPQLSVAEGDELRVTVDASSYRAGLILTEPQVDLSANQILFVDAGFNQSIELDPENRDQQLVITIEYLVNPLSNEASSSFEIVTFNRKNNVLYQIDIVESGLSIKNKCNYPCETCLSTNPNFC